MKQVEVGIRIGDKGITFVGVEEVNGLIAQGGRITSVEPGEAIVEALDSEGTKLALAGCTLKINIQL